MKRCILLVVLCEYVKERVELHLYSPLGLRGLFLGWALPLPLYCSYEYISTGWLLNYTANYVENFNSCFVISPLYSNMKAYLR